MLNYSLKCKKDTENANLKVIKTENGRACYTQNVPYMVIKKSRFIKEQDAKGLLSS